jgi:hypothetical protein
MSFPTMATGKNAGKSVIADEATVKRGVSEGWLKPAAGSPADAPAQDIGTTRTDTGTGTGVDDSAGGISYTGNEADALGRPRARRRGQARDILG